MIIMATLSPTSEGVVIFFVSDQPKKMGNIAPSVTKKLGGKYDRELCYKGNP